ncbi:MAG: serine O-acetyltransferase [Clostridia bacterium]|nr:serine O-acetyltransferase [Clostridia bacterium]
MNSNTDYKSDIEAFERRIIELKKKADKALGNLKSEVRSIRDRDPAARSDAEVLLLYPGLHAVIAHRIANKLYKSGKFFAARAVSQWARNITGIEIHPAAQIGKGLFIDHGCAVVIGETTVIGDNCTIYQGATLGGTGKHVGKRHPTIGNNVMIGAGAKVLGPITIGDNSKIAAGAVVLKDIPENSTAVGVPARVVRGKHVEKEQSLDQLNVPDPVAQELALLRSRIEELEKRLEEKE